MRKLIAGVALLVTVASSAQAYQVFCNFDGVFDSHPNTGAPDYTETSYSAFVKYVEYEVVVGVGEVLTDFYVGAVYAGAPAWVSTDTGADNPVAGWGLVGPGPRVEADTYTPDQVVSTSPDFQIGSLHYAGVPLTAGVYYIGYDVPDAVYALIDTGWRCDSAPTQVENWTQDVSGGAGPVHTIPEPGTLALALVGVGTVALRRCFRRG